MNRTQTAAAFEQKDGGGAGDLPMVELKKAIDGQGRAFEEFKATNDARLKDLEKRGAADVVTVDKLDKIEKSLAAFEGLNQKITLAEQQRKAQQDQLDNLELKLNRPNFGGNPADRRIELKKKVDAWARAVVFAHTAGVANLKDEHRKALEDVAAECKAMAIGNDTTGGYLAPPEFVMEIIKGVTEISPMRSICRVRPTAHKTIEVPKRTGQFAARRTHEDANRSETTGLTYGMEELTAPEMYAMVDISQQNLEDSGWDLEAEIRMEAVEQFAVKEGAEFVSGTTKIECEGILSTSAGLATTNSGSATTIADADGQANGLLTLYSDLKTAYAREAVWILNRKTIGSVRKLKTSDKQYLWQPGLANGIPNLINGVPYVEFPDMPNEGAGAKPIAFGDFRRGYTIVDRISMEMLRDPYTQAATGRVRFWFRRRVGGQVVLSEAIRTLTCST